MRVSQSLLLSAVLISTAGAARAADAPVPASGYFVDCAAGSDAAAGTSHLTPWRSLTKVNGTVGATGADVWIKGGTTCDNQTLDVDWSGTPSDRVVIGSYYVSGGVAYQLTPDMWLANPQDAAYSNGTRATIQGSYRLSCRRWPSKCAFTNLVGTTPGTRVPNSIYDPMVGLVGQYVTVQDLSVKDSAGMGIGVIRSQGNCQRPNPACESYGVVQRNKVSHTAGSGILAPGSRYVVARENEVEFTDLAWRDSQPSQNNFGVGMGSFNCDPCYSLWENNWVHDTSGEGIGNYGTANVLVRGNRIANVRTVPIYFDGAAEVVAEQNIVAGGQVTLEAGLGDPAKSRGPAFAGILPIHEGVGTGNTTANAAKRQMVRNNLIANVTACLGMGTYPDIPAGKVLNGKTIGNTCVNPTGYYAMSWQGNFALITSPFYSLQNNIFATTTGAPVCQADAVGSTVITDHNFWTTTPSANCRSPGTGDVYSTFAALDIPAGTLATADKSTFPTADSFLPNVGSSVTSGAASLDTASILTASQWTWVLAQRQWSPSCGSGLLSSANWEKDLYADYCDAPRTGWIGAMQPGATVGFDLMVD